MKTQCPHCKARFNTNEKSIGKQAKCPKCGKPFTIEPLIEPPVAVETSVAVEPPAPASTAKRGEKSPPLARPRPLAGPEPVGPQAKIAIPMEPPAKSTTPIAPPALSGVASAKADKSPEPIATPAKIVESVAPPVKSPEPVELPVKSAVPVAIPAKSVEPVKPPVKSAEVVAATSAEPVKGEKPKAKALSKTVFVYCWAAVRIIAGILGALGLMLAIRKETHSTLIATFAAADVFLVCSVLVELALFYKMWAAIGDNQASVSPAKAVGLLFIPVFNIYWALYMLTGFAEDYNAFIQRRSVKTKDLPLILFLIYAFMFILAATVLTTPMICVFAFIKLISRAFISYTLASWVLFSFAFAAGLGHFIAYIVVAIKTCNAINALPGIKGR